MKTYKKIAYRHISRGLYVVYQTKKYSYISQGYCNSLANVKAGVNSGFYKF